MNIFEKYGLKPRVVGLLALLFLGFVVLLWWFLPKPGPSLPEVETTSPTSESEFAVAEATPTETAVAEETPTPEATPTATPTATATPKPTSTPTPTHTPTPTPTFTPTPTPTPEAVIEFGADSTALNLFQCTNLWWNVENIKEVYLIRDGGVPEGVPGENQTREVCPGDDTTFILRVKKLDDSIVEPSVTIAVQGKYFALTFTQIEIRNDDGDSDYCVVGQCPTLDYGNGDVRLEIKVQVTGQTTWCYLPHPVGSTWSIYKGETFNIPAPSGFCFKMPVPEGSDMKIFPRVLEVDTSSESELDNMGQVIYPFYFDWEADNPHKSWGGYNNVALTWKLDIVDTK